MQTKTEEKIAPPEAPAKITIRQLHEILSRPVPKNQIKIKPGKARAKYLSWQFAQTVLNRYCLGYHWKIKSIQQLGDRVAVIGELLVPCADGNVSVESCGSAPLESSSHADPVCVAEQQSFKRCAKRLGLGLNLDD